ncbi:MAG: AAA family ATPase [Nanobdellota archaeon]
MAQVIIGITGTQGSGKGTVVDFIKEKGFLHFSVSNKIVEIIKQRGMEVNRDSMRIVADDLRKNKFPGYNVFILMKEASRKGKDCVIESIRCPSEIDVLREVAKKEKKDFYLLSIDADVNERYKRVVGRRGVKDNISFEKFVQQEEKEMNNEESWKMNIKRCISKSDYRINNDGNFEDLKDKVEGFFRYIGL